MEDVQNINKTIYKLTLFTIKLMPIIISFIYFINAVLSLFGYDIPCLSIIAGTSIITVLFLYLISTAFRFCFYHRIFIHYILINNIITINDFLNNSRMLSVCLIFLFFLCSIGLLIFRYYERHNQIYN